MSNPLLYALTVLFWGTSWLAITFQLGEVAPAASILYRFALAAAVMFAACLAARRPMRFAARDHAFIALQGLLLFSTNYVFIYFATAHITSGQVAMAFAAIVVLNILGSAVFFGMPIQPRIVLGAAAGIVGLALVFWPEIRAFDWDRSGSAGLVLALTGTISASLGNMVSLRNQRRGLPVIQTNAYGMAYGSGLLLLFCLVQDTPFTFAWTFAYVASLLYLAIGATVLAFWSYLTLLGRIGPDRAAYASVVFPVLALALSTLFEDFVWTPAAVAGVALVLAGNVLVLGRGATRKAGTAGTAGRSR